VQAREYLCATVLKFDANGNLQWGQLAGGAEFDEANAVQQTSDGGYTSLQVKLPALEQEALMPSCSSMMGPERCSGLEPSAAAATMSPTRCSRLRMAVTSLPDALPASLPPIITCS